MQTAKNENETIAVINPLAPLACPLDGLPLSDGGVSWQCEKNHQFDLARQGYLNLLPASQKTSRDPGDSKAMVAARRNVMASGLYESAALALSAQLVSRIKPVDDRALVILDAGCGEGYYTDHMRVALHSSLQVSPPVFMGVDISKWAIVVAARLYPDVTWAVGNNKHLPVLPGSVDVITSVFGFETWQPWAALQSVGQQVLVAHAGPLHLIELRQLVYDTVNIHGSADDSEAVAAGYRLVHQSTAKSHGSVCSVELVAQVLAMTPHGHRIAADKQAGLQAGLATLANQPLTVDVTYRWYERCDS